MADLSASHRAMFNSFLQPDPHSEGVYKFLMDLYPAFAKKVFEGGGFVAKLVRSGLNPIDIMDYHICGRCEALAPLSGFAKKNGRLVNKCTCMKEGCGATTIDPPTFRDWMKDELRHKAPPDIAEVADMAVDAIAMNMMKKAEQELARAMSMDNAKRNEKTGILMPDGSMHEVQKARISVNESPLSDAEYNRLLSE